MGKLYLRPTPVGNLEDMTFRAVRVLKEVDLILAEDTRTTSFLLKHFQIENKMLSHHKFNEHKTVEGIAQRIKAGETVALVSDAELPPSQTLDSFWFVNVWRMVSWWNAFPELRRLSQLWWIPASLTTDSVSRGYFPKRRGDRPKLRSWPKNGGR